MEKVAPYAKAVVAALIAGLASAQQALDGNNDIDGSEWIAVALATLVGLGAVFAIPNRDPQAMHQDESVQPPQAGYGAIELLVGVVVLIIVVWLLLALIARV